MDKKKLSLIFSVIFLVISLVVFLSVKANRKYAERIEVEEQKKQGAPEELDILTLQKQLTGAMELDIAEGNNDAKVVIIEYASYSCSHCSAFYKNIYPKLKSTYIDSGDVKFVYRDFPLDEPALRASQLVHCLPEDSKKGFMKVLFENQSAWAYTKQFPEKLENFAKISGMSSELFHSCMADESLEQKILQSRLSAHKAFKISSTPSLIINGQRFIGRTNWYEISEYINNLLKN